MRPEFDSEIDSVLRGHARRGGGLPSAWDAVSRPSIPDEAASGSHLDADEIAAFGEDALPASARARYSAHLADCDHCRRSVTQVAFAAGLVDKINERERAEEMAAVAARDEGLARAATAAFATRSPSVARQSASDARRSETVAARPASWRERVSSLFAPRAWRYAMPVVALFAVGVVALVLMRNTSNEDTPEIASRGGNAAQRATAPAANAAPESHHADATPQQQEELGLAKSQPSDAAAAAGASPADEKSEAAAAGGEGAKLSPNLAVSQSAPGGAGRVGGVAQTETVQVTSANPARPSESYAAAATPLPPPAAAPAPRPMLSRDGLAVPQPTPAPVGPELGERARAESRARSGEEPPTTKRQGPQRGIVGRADSADEAPKDDRAMASSRRARGGPAKNEANRNDSDESRAKESKAKREAGNVEGEDDREQQMRTLERGETRSVAGRKFRREGDAWIDTAYRAGQDTVSMRRGSEQYRTLVGDEPEIGRIHRALGGEVVVVWKGKAYRIRP